MDINELNSFGLELEKIAIPFGLLSRTAGKPGLLKRFLRRKTINQRRSVSTLAATGAIVGAIGLGGAAYGAVKQPASRRPKTGRFPY